MKKFDTKWPYIIPILFCVGCLGAQLVQVPQQSEYAPQNYITPPGMVRYPIAPMKGTRRTPVTPDYAVKHRESAFQAMAEACGSTPYEIVREEEIVVEGEAVWIQIHFSCVGNSNDAGPVSQSNLDGGV